MVSSLPLKIDWPLNKNPWNTEVLRHEMLPRVLLYILSQPCDLVLLNCSAGFHRAPCIAALLFAILVASHLNFMSGVCVVLWVRGQFGIFFSTPSMRFKACDVEVVVMITSLSKSWSTDLRTLYAYLQGSLDQFLAWHYHRLFFSPEAFYLSQLIFFVMGWVSKAAVAEAYCHDIHHAKQLVLQVQGAVHTDCLWDSR